MEISLHLGWCLGFFLVFTVTLNVGMSPVSDCASVYPISSTSNVSVG